MHPAAVFSSKEHADEWIENNKLSGSLTAYPLDQSVYDWVISNGLFKPKFPSQSSSEFIQRFSSAYAEHFHYEKGIQVS